MMAVREEALAALCGGGIIEGAPMDVTFGAIELLVIRRRIPRRQLSLRTFLSSQWESAS